MITRPLVDDNIEDAKSVVRDRFDETACQLLDREMANPLRRLCSEAGDIVYDDDGSPVCFQADMLRRMYLGSQEIIGKVGGMTCLKKGAPVEAVIDVKQAARKLRGGCVMGFGNSQCVVAAGMARKMKNVSMGPESTTRYLWRAIRPFSCLMYFIHRKIFRRAMPSWSEFSTLEHFDYNEQFEKFCIRRLASLDPTFFNVLMEAYRKTNEGLVCSRTVEELDWMFGERIRDGRVVVLGAYDEHGMPIGYLMMDGGRPARRWMLADWFALQNDQRILEALLSSACRFLRKRTPAMLLETMGFPTYIQPLLKKYLPFVRRYPCNAFSWGSGNKEFRESLKQIIDTPKSWFFGPYDGDLVM